MWRVAEGGAERSSEQRGEGEVPFSWGLDCPFLAFACHYAASTLSTESRAIEGATSATLGWQQQQQQRDSE